MSRARSSRVISMAASLQTTHCYAPAARRRGWYVSAPTTLRVGGFERRRRITK